MDRVTKFGVWILWSLTFAVLVIGCGDLLPPTTPKNLLVNAISASEIKVSWDNSTARTSIKEYRLYRDSSFYIATNTTSYDDTGLTNSTEYCYKVQAVDEDGNHSDKSDTKCDTTFASNDTQNPTAPTNLTATVINSTRIDLAWTKSTDDTGIKQYDIFRDAVYNTSVSGLYNSYSDTGLTNSTKYCYFVNAVDLVGHNSVSSSSVCNTTAP